MIDERMDIELARGVGGGAAGLAVRDDRSGRQDRSGDAAARGQHPLPRDRSPTTSCRATSPAGTSRCCRSRATTSTRFISPTKTPEYLAAGKPVVSTSIRDVVRPYGELGLARIADTADEFVARCRAQRSPSRDADARDGCRRVPGATCRGTATWARMWRLVEDVRAAERAAWTPRGTTAAAGIAAPTRRCGDMP